jgi:hypothetical protein
VSARSLRRRITSLAAVGLVAIGLSILDTTPAAAAGVGYVRLAHLSPDTPNVDVYFSSPSGAVPAKTIPGVGYGTVSDYLTVPTGTYAVAMRGAGAPADSQPVLTTQVNVEAGKAYTVAGVGRHADLGLRVIPDDLTLPDSGQARVRIVQASIQAPILDVSVASGSPIADNVAFASTTGYRDVNQGKWTVKLQQTGGGTNTTVQCQLTGGSVYSLFVLDRPTGLTAELRTDASRRGGMPRGGMETGAGGGQRDRGTPTPVLVTTSMLLLLAGGLTLSRRRRAYR